MDFSLKLRQELKLVLTQEMKISLNILEMSTTDIEKFLIKEKEKNPLIELDFSNKRGIRTKEDLEDGGSPFDYATREESLIDFLEEQLGYLKINKELRFISSFIINNLDRRGYLPMRTSEIKSLVGGKITLIEEGLKIVRSLDPIGIGSYNLEDCLIFQLHKNKIYDKKLEIIIKNFLKEIGSSNFSLIREKLNLSDEEIRAYIKIIRQLNPIPSRGYYMGDNTSYIAPEAEIKEVDGRYEVIMTSNLPKIKIRSHEENKENKGFVLSAENLIKFMYKRQETLEKILNIILEKQYDYFSKKSKKLKTFTLKEVAENLEIHESTVSRAIKNKYVLTEEGVRRIKDFFVVSENRGEIIEIIESIISKEDRNKPLSDQKIVEILGIDHGLEVARRTVAKYREDLGILSSSKRKIRL